MRYRLQVRNNFRCQDLSALQSIQKPLTVTQLLSFTVSVTSMSRAPARNGAAPRRPGDEDGEKSPTDCFYTSLTRTHPQTSALSANPPATSTHPCASS